MKLQVSLSASMCKKGDRVIVRVKKNEWHLATVIKSGLTVVVDFDDDHDAVITNKDFKWIKLLDSRTPKDARMMNDQQAADLIVAFPPLPKKQKALPPDVQKVIADLKSGKIKGVPLSKVTNPNFGRRFSQLEMYLEGDQVTDEWLEEMMARRSKEQPAKLYRMCIASGTAKEGTTINVKKGVISAADRINSAIYGGCSFHKDHGTDIGGKQLCVIEIHSPTVLMSFKEIVDEVPVTNRMAHERLQNEREFLIKGPISGKVIQIVPHSFLLSRNYKTLEI